MANQKTCIVTGGAGFIGCAISAGLTKVYDRVIAVDTLNPQIHPKPVRPELLDEEVELIVGSVCDDALWDSLLSQLEAGFTVVHLAAETGTAQSLTCATLHTYTNVVGTSKMLDAFVRSEKMPSQILLTSSRAVYGEGAWKREDGSEFYPGQRSDHQLNAGQWDFPNAVNLPMCAEKTVPMPTSVYGSTKLCQENLLGAWCKAMNVQCKILRLQNVYGPGQSLINPYTGIVSLFVRMAKEGKVIPLYEDGEIIRDFVLIDDVARAIVLDLQSEAGVGRVFDVGTGVRSTIGDMARIIAAHYGAPEPQVCGKYRNGDVRHAYCDPQAAKEALGFQAEFSLEDGLLRLCDWIDQNLTEEARYRG